MVARSTRHIGWKTYESYRHLLDTPRWQRIFNAGGRPRRLLFAGTGTKDPKASDTLYVRRLPHPSP